MSKTKAIWCTPSDVGACWCGEAIGKKLVAMTYEGGWMVNFMKQTYPTCSGQAVPLPTGPKGHGRHHLHQRASASTQPPSSRRPRPRLAIFVTSAVNQG